MAEDGQLFYDKDAPGRDELDDDFWRDAHVSFRGERKSVHLKVDEYVFEYFKALGKGHLTRMQDVLRAYVDAQRR